MQVHITGSMLTIGGDPGFERAAVQQAEMLAAGGYRLTVYRNIAPAPGEQPVAEYDPLREQPETFDVEGANK